MLCVVAGIGWVFVIPFDARVLYRAIPPNAILVSEHRDLNGRWRDVASNSVVRVATELAGISDEEYQDALMDEGLAKALSVLGRRFMLLAYVPNLSESGYGCWILAGWAGGGTQLVRIGGLKIAGADELEKCEVEGETIWLYRSDDLPKGEYLSLAVCEGAVVGCLSMDPYAVRYVIGRVREGMPLMPLLDERADKMAAGEESPGYLDWMAVKRYGGSYLGNGFMSEEWCEVKARFHGAGGIEVWSSLREGWAEGSGWQKGSGLEIDEGVKSLEKMLVADVNTLVVAPYGLVQAVAAENSKAFAILGDYFASSVDNDALAFAAVLGEDYRGTVLGRTSLPGALTLPSVVVGVQVMTNMPLYDFAGKVLDRLNRRYKWGVIPKKLAIDGIEAVAIEPTEPMARSLLGADECPTLVLADGWLLLFSNGKAVMRFAVQRILRAGGEGGEEKGISAGWVSAIESEAGSIRGWSDLEGASAECRNLYGTATIVLMPFPDLLPTVRPKMDLVLSWIVGANKLGQVKVSIDLDGDREIVHLETTQE